MKEHDHVTESFTALIGGRSFPVSRGENLGSLLQSAFPDGRAVSALTDAERKYLTEAELAAGMRLACQTYAEGNVELTLPEAEHGARIITDGELPPFTLEPGFEAFGAAVDIGTTTVAAALYDARGQLRAKASMLNPQRQWGADVISRMEAALAGSAADLADAIRGAINELLIRMAAQAGIGAECIDGAVITGNTVMLHLLAGINTKPLTRAPFIAEELFGRTFSAAELGFSALLPATPVYLHRGVRRRGYHVGADGGRVVFARTLGTAHGHRHQRRNGAEYKRPPAGVLNRRGARV